MITRPSGCRGRCQSRHIVRGTTFRIRMDQGHIQESRSGGDVGRVSQHHQHVETERQVDVELLRRLLLERGSGVSGQKRA